MDYWISIYAYKAVFCGDKLCVLVLLCTCHREDSSVTWLSSCQGTSLGAEVLQEPSHIVVELLP